MAGSSSIKHNTEFLQKVDFEGMDYLLRGRRMVPLSDVDGLIDAEGKGWILYELKYGDANLPTGQRILFENMINDLSVAKPAVCFVCSHDMKDAGKDIFLKDAIVTAVYSKKFGWKYYGQDYARRWTAKELTDIFLKRYAPDMLTSKTASDHSSFGRLRSSGSAASTESITKAFSDLPAASAAS